ncbi:flagellar biosynthesis protein FlgB [Methylobacterium sp. Leaf399]|uniref:flagellar basal body rod protein FlgB n=1 Tax=unclassified Methylobacterium TaxID=2615210 RepID=UPI0006FB4129|nr:MULTISPECIES: flagellar basal body rod protein FlgB [unclassified Methylobacterium]KQP55226.1 flagellar biosynthesis protein FlgB [Methylobacterium sp. Leaf108]KQT09966.1 flagellar biosynthesis protein FlgB [Methylobacterium sp. Leaf399]
MTGVYLFEIASQQARHLAVRQATIASNVANANTPDYKARDVVPFAEVLSRAGSMTGLAMTASAHVASAESPVPTRPVKAEAAWDALETSSSVSLEQEMLKAGEVSRDHNLNTGIVKAFHRMLMSAVRAG